MMRNLAIALGAALAIVSWNVVPANAADAVAPAVVGASGTVTGDATFHLNSTPVSGGRAVTMRWNPCQARVTYQVNATLAGSTDASRTSAIRDTQEAFARLSAATGITFAYTGTTRAVPSGSRWADSMSSAEIVVAWVGPHQSTLLGSVSGSHAAATGGYSYKTWAYPGKPWQGVIGRGFVVVNAAQNAAFRPGFGSGVTRGNLLLHELGHVVGLNHTEATSQVMYPVLISRASSGYRSGDLLGLRKLGWTSGCIAVPDGMYADI